jgi:hypothetical protein
MTQSESVDVPLGIRDVDANRDNDRPPKDELWRRVRPELRTKAHVDRRERRIRRSANRAVVNRCVAFDRVLIEWESAISHSASHRGRRLTCAERS